MKKVVTLIALSMLMAGCVSNGKVSVNREQLQHHRFVLQSVNGKAVTTANNPPELSFGKLSDGELKVKDMAMTRMMCADPQLNALDGIVSEMFKQGAQVDLTADQLTLATAEQTLTYKLADLM